MTTSAKAYSYVRFSSKKQEQGDSIRRQTEATAAWAKRNGITLDTSLEPDCGVSAYRGKNTDVGSLGAFLRHVEAGRVLPGSCLVVESLDRLSRQQIQPALLLVLSLLQRGIRIVQLQPTEIVYDDKSDTTPIILMLVELSRANSESRVKSERVHAAWGERRKRARKGEILTHKLPAWVEERNGKLVAIPERVGAIRSIFEWSESGLGISMIQRRLIAEGIPAFGSSGRWSYAYLHLLLSDRRVTGEFTPMVSVNGAKSAQPDGAPIPDYYPRVVSDGLFERVAMGLRSRRRKSGKIGSRVNVFSGLVRSARDGFAFIMRKPSEKQFRYQLFASGYRNGTTICDTFPLDSFEGAVLSLLREIDPAEVLSSESRSESVCIAAELRDVELQLERIESELVNMSDNVPALARASATLNTRRVELSRRLAEAKQLEAAPLSESWGNCRTLLDALAMAPDEQEARLRLREALRRVVKGIVMLVLPGRRIRHALIQIFFVGDPERSRTVLVRHVGAIAAGHNKCIRKPATWEARSFAAGDGLDLRKPADVKQAEELLKAIAAGS